MSRHELGPRPGSDATEVAAGWDPALDTFYGQAFDRRNDEEDAELVWIGTAPREVSDPAEVVDALRPYAEIPDDLADRLAADRTREGERYADRPSVIRDLLEEFNGPS